MTKINIDLENVHKLLEQNSKSDSKGVNGLEELGFIKRDLSKPLTLGKYEYTKNLEDGIIQVIVSFLDRDRAFDVRPDGVEVVVKKNDEVIKTYRWIEPW